MVPQRGSGKWLVVSGQKKPTATAKAKAKATAKAKAKAKCGGSSLRSE